MVQKKLRLPKKWDESATENNEGNGTVLHWHKMLKEWLEFQLIAPDARVFIHEVDCTGSAFPYAEGKVNVQGLLAKLAGWVAQGHGHFRWELIWDDDDMHDMVVGMGVHRDCLVIDCEPDHDAEDCQHK